VSVSAVVRKELRQLSRDPRTIAVLLLVPALLLLFYGYVLSFDVHHVSLAVLDHDRTTASRALVQAMTSREYFDKVENLHSEEQIDPALQSGRATIVLVFPQGFGKALESGGEAEVQALIDGSNATSAQTAQGYSDAYVQAQGSTLIPAGGVPITPALHVLYNPELSSDRFLLPGLVAFILMITASVFTALSVVKEREAGTMEQLLVSPLRTTDVVLGKALPYGSLALVSALVVLATARIAFGLHVAGSLVLLVLVTLLFVAGAQGLGLVISSFTRSQQVAFQIAAFATMLPTLLLSGFIFPIRSMPLPLQLLSFIVPGRYFVSVLRGIVLKGVGVRVLWSDIIALIIFASATLAIASLRLRRRQL
jgi:ABC-2 type transport system permease protein